MAKVKRTVSENIRASEEARAARSEWSLDKKIEHIKKSLIARKKPVNLQNIWSGLNTYFPEVRDVITLDEVKNAVKKKPAGSGKKSKPNGE